MEMAQGSRLRGAESGVAAVDDVLEVGGRDFRGGDVEGKNLVGDLGEAEILPTLPRVGVGNVLGDEQATIVGEALEDGLFEGELYDGGQGQAKEHTEWNGTEWDGME